MNKENKEEVLITRMTKKEKDKVRQEAKQKKETMSEINRQVLQEHYDGDNN